MSENDCAALSAAVVGARLDRLPLAGIHRRILLLIASGGMVDAFDVYLAGSVMAALLDSGFATLSQNAAFVSSTFAGMLIGSAFAGWIGDRFGRRTCYQINLLIFGAASIAAAFSPTMTWLIAFRFIIGVGLGAELVVASGTLSEFVPPPHRARLGAMLGLVINTGLLIANGCAYLVIPTLGWRWMFGIAGIAAFIVWLARHGLPESPRWLATVGREREALAVLARIEAAVEKECGTLPAPTMAQPCPAPQLNALWKAPLRSRLVMAALLLIALNVALYGLMAWLPTFLIQSGIPITQSLAYTALMSLGAPIGSLTVWAIGERLPRRIVTAAASLVIVAASIAYALGRDPTELTAAGFVMAIGIYGLIGMGLYVYIPELFPTALRLRANGVAYVCGRAASIVAPYAILGLYGRSGLFGVLGLVDGLLLALFATILAVGIETRKRPLEEIALYETL